MSKRQLTLLVELDETERPDWLWEILKSGRSKNGFKVKVICEGNQLADHFVDDEGE